MNALLLAGLVAVGAVTSLPWALRWVRRRRTKSAWLELSPKLELPLAGGSNERLLSGRYRGHPVEVRLTPHGTSQVRVPLKTPLPAGLHLSRQVPGAMRRPGRAVRDIQVGDPALDEGFLIQGKNPAAVIRLLREPGVREALLALQADSPWVLITENEVMAPLASPVREETCRRALRSTALLTSALEETTARHQLLAATARDQARRELPAVPSPRPAETAPSRDEVLGQGSEDPALALIRDEFARRMRIHNWFGTYPTVAGFVLLCLCAVMSTGSETLLGQPLLYWALAGGGLVVAGLLGHHVISRKILLCPACGLDVIEPDPELQQFGKGEEGITISLTLSTDICPNCRTVLS